jgi:signal transduction histidine kinase
MKAGRLVLATTRKSQVADLSNRPGPHKARLRSLSTPVDTGPVDERVNILIVDDEPKNLTVLETVLDDPGYRLLRAESGEQALLALMSEEFAVLVLDIRMPGMSGIELARMIKERKKTAQVPIIFLTAYYNEDQHVLAGYDTGAVDYLHKPVNAAVLRSKVAVFAELYRKGRSLEQTNAALLEEVTERRRAEAQLRDLNETLDRRVIERTQALQASNIDLKRMETQLREADRRKDEFLATLAHELRNPLAPVCNAVHILREKGSDSPELQWARDVIDRQVRAMTHLIDDLMDVSRINLAKIDLRLEEVDLADVLRGAIETSRPLIDECRHELVLALPADPLPVSADPIRLGQVFMNLLNNAAKYMDHGGRIDVNVSREDNDVVVSVKDRGIGIASDRLEEVFAMFSQVEDALSRSRGGLGVGLALARRLVEMHGGRVTALSEGSGKGAEFQVRLQSLAMERAATPAAPAQKSDGPGTALRILVADDNEDTAITLGKLLEFMGHEVRTALDGLAAVEIASGFQPQVAVLDIGMPKLNGLDACRQIRTQSGGEGMILIAVTGWGQAEDQRMTHEAGFNHHLVKPVDPMALTDLIARLAAKRKVAPGG